MSSGSTQLSPLGSLLLDLDDLAAQEPVGVHHRRVDGSRDAPPSLIQDSSDALVEVLLGRRGELAPHVLVHTTTPVDRTRPRPTARGPRTCIRESQRFDSHVPFGGAPPFVEVRTPEDYVTNRRLKETPARSQLDVLGLDALSTTIARWERDLVAARLRALDQNERVAEPDAVGQEAHDAS